MTYALHLGDCLEYMKSMPDKSVDAVITDPPYGVGLGYSVYKDTEENWYKLMLDFVPEATRISEIVILPSCQINRLGWIYKNIPPDWLISWNKGSTGCSSKIGFNDWEPLLIYGRRKGVWMHDYFYCANTEKMGNYGHPCPKPVGWARWLIDRSDSQIVFDPFMGSGTTGVAAIQLGRNFIGCEIDPTYYAIAEKRIKEATLQPQLFPSHVGNSETQEKLI
jgi:site-specific DNA-methyltransferase (adenine-specific)